MITAPITTFSGQNSFLSNFFQTLVYCKDYDRVFISVENAYQALKNNDGGWVSFCETATPAETKVQSKSVPLRPDWEKVKIDLMHQLLIEKFESNPVLREKLIKTADRFLMEGNNWGDIFWGVDLKSYKGANILGQLLMKVRERLNILEKALVENDLFAEERLFIDKRSPILNNKYPTGIYIMGEINGNRVTIKREGALSGFEHSREFIITELQKKRFSYRESLYVLLDIEVGVDTTIISHK